LQAESRVAILLHDGIKGSQGKTGLALLRYSHAQIVAVIDRQCAGESLPVVSGINRDIPIVASVEEALAYNPDTLAIGIAPSGGILPPEWQQEVKQAIFAGLSIANGLHTPLATIPEFRDSLRPGQWIWDVRQEPANLPIASGQAQTLACRRVLAVGTDMAVGKMSACLELHQTCQKRGLRSKFIATGQAGLMIAGDGIPLDAIRVDFAAGAVEQTVMQHGSDRDIVFVEGQGSLLHPGSTATLPLIRGTQPTHLILVHRAGQTHIRNHPHVPIPALTDVVQLYEMVAKAAGAFADVPVVAIALNTFHLDLATARQEIERAQAETGLPCNDVVRFGSEDIVDAIVNSRN